MKRFCLIFAVLSCIFITNTSRAQFPNGWTGTWEGDLIVHSQPGDINRIVGMKIVIEETGDAEVRNWKIFYDDNNGGSWRNYTLVGNNPQDGIYKMDEDNSIILDMFYFNDVFYSMYEVGKGLITVRYELKDGKMYFEVTSANTDSELTGGEGETIEVKNYLVRTVQKAILTRQN